MRPPAGWEFSYTHRVGLASGPSSVQQRPALWTERGACRRIGTTHNLRDGERAVRAEDDVSRPV